MMLILIKIHLELKKAVSNVIIEDLGVGGSQCCRLFLGTSTNYIFFQKQKKRRSMYSEYAKFILFSNFMMIFAYITPIFGG